MLHVQEYLKTKSLNQLEEEHGVGASFDKDKTKFSLNYSQINSRSTDSLANQCRGLILRWKDHKTTLDNLDFTGETEIVACPMDRFFNYGDSAAIQIDWSNASVEEKLDGTLCIVYFDKFKEQWCIATRSVPEADVPIDGCEQTFATLFHKAVHEQHQENFVIFCDYYLDKEYTHCFELCT